MLIGKLSFNLESVIAFAVLFVSEFAGYVFFIAHWIASFYSLFLPSPKAREVVELIECVSDIEGFNLKGPSNSYFPYVKSSRCA
jgi:hypothetical protein